MVTDVGAASINERLRLFWRAWRYRIRLDPDEIKFIREWLSPGDTAIDVGAHKGGYMYWMRKAVGSTGRVIAFEPQPELASYLAGFKFPNVVVENLALSDENGSSILTIPGSKSSPSASLSGHVGGRQVSVKTTTLDSYCEQNLDTVVRLAKIDVEGHEEKVFHGAERLLHDHRPALVFECEERHVVSRMQSIFEYLEDQGYNGYFFTRGQRKPIIEFAAGKYQVLGTHPYINNFIFIPGKIS